MDTPFSRKLAAKCGKPAGARPVGPRPRQPGLALLLGAIVLVVVAFGLWFVRGWVSPVPHEPFDDGPIVVLGGGGDRVGVGLDLVTDEPRDLVLSSSAAVIYENRGGDCEGVGVRCVEPVPETTFGEATLVSRLAHEEGWERITVVTIDTHVKRSRMLFERCVDVPVAFVAVPTPRDTDRLGRSLREAAGTVAQALVHRCP